MPGIPINQQPLQVIVWLRSVARVKEAHAAVDAPGLHNYLFVERTRQAILVPGGWCGPLDTSGPAVKSRTHSSHTRGLEVSKSGLVALSSF